MEGGGVLFYLSVAAIMEAAYPTSAAILVVAEGWVAVERSITEVEAFLFREL